MSGTQDGMVRNGQRAPACWRGLRGRATRLLAAAISSLAAVPRITLAALASGPIDVGHLVGSRLPVCSLLRSFKPRLRSAAPYVGPTCASRPPDNELAPGKVPVGPPVRLLVSASLPLITWHRPPPAHRGVTPPRPQQVLKYARILQSTVEASS